MVLTDFIEGYCIISPAKHVVIASKACSLTRVSHSAYKKCCISFRSHQQGILFECLTRERTYILSNVFLKFSEFALLQGEEHPFSNKYRATVSSILTDYLSSEYIANTSIEKLVDFVNKKSRKKISVPQMIQQAARNSYRLDKCLYELLTTSIACSFKCIQVFE